MSNARSILLLLLLYLPSLALAKGSPAGFVAAFRADANILRDGESVVASIGQKVYVGDELVTGKKGRLKVLLTDDAIISLGANTSVRISKHFFEPSKHKRLSRLDLVRGMVRALVKHMVADTEADFQVRHSNAVAGVRGTEFAMYTTEEGVKLATLSGTVAWSLDGQQATLVHTGQASVAKDDGVSTPEALAAADLNTLRKDTDLVQSPSALAMNIEPKNRASMSPSLGDSMGLPSPNDSLDVKNDSDHLDGGFSVQPGERNGGGLGTSSGYGGATFSGRGSEWDSGNGSEVLEGQWSTGLWGDPGDLNVDVQLEILVERR